MQAAGLEAVRPFTEPADEVLLNGVAPLFVVRAVRQPGVVGEQGGHVGPQPELRVLGVCLLNAFDGAHGFGPFHVLAQPEDTCSSARSRVGVPATATCMAPSAPRAPRAIASPLDFIG